MILNREFLLDCFKEIEISSNLKILNTCKEWRELFLYTHQVSKKIPLGKLYKISLQKEFLSGNVIPISSELNPYFDREFKIYEVIVAAHMFDGIICLCLVKDDFLNLFILIDTKSLEKQVEMKIPYKFSILDQIYYRLEMTSNGLIINESMKCYFSKFIHFDDCILYLENINISSNIVDIIKRKVLLEEIYPGDQIESFEMQKTIVKLTIPSKKELDTLPLWYIPQYYRVPNSVLIEEKENFINLPLDKIKNVFKSSKITAYISGKEFLQIGFYVVLFAPEFPLGYVKKTMEKYFLLIIDGKKYFLQYNAPQFKIFESKKNAEKWREKRLKITKELLPFIKPGDVIMKGFQNRLLGKNTQSYAIIKRISFGNDKIKDDQKIDMEEIDNYLFFNNIDEDLDEDEKKTSVTQYDGRRRFYIGDKNFIHQDNIQGIFL